jgi:putative transposase
MLRQEQCSLSVPHEVLWWYGFAMARLARIVVPGCPHHVTAPGNRRKPILFDDRDQEIYLDILAEQTRKAKVEVWAYCLMPNHVHLILCPAPEAGLARAMGAAHRRWATFINGRGRWLGHLFDGRYASVAMDDGHLTAAVRYVALNPVRARLVERATDWPCSSVHAHLSGRDDGLVVVRPVLERVGAFAEVIDGDADDAGLAALRAAEGTGRAIGTPEFVADLERRLGRQIARHAAGRKPARTADEQIRLL